MDHFAITLGRTFAGFFVLLILTRLIGKKQLSQITMFNYITGIALGNIAGDMVVHRDINLADGIMGLVLWTLLAIGIEYLALKSSKTRILLDGEPTILIKDGRLIEKSLISNRLNIDDLTMLLRDKGIFSIQEADYAILEPNGKLSILKKMEYENTVKSDFHLHKKRKFLPAELIAGGNLVKKIWRKQLFQKNGCEISYGKKEQLDMMKCCMRNFRKMALSMFKKKVKPINLRLHFL